MAPPHGNTVTKPAPSGSVAVTLSITEVTGALVVDGAPTGTRVTEPAARVIKWEITSEPAGAVIMRRGDRTVLGQTPWKHSQDAGSGMMEVELRKQGYVPKRLQLDLGSDVSLQSKLSPESSAPDRKDRGKRGKPVRKKGSSIRDNNDVPVLH